MKDRYLIRMDTGGNLWILCTDNMWNKLYNPTNKPYRFSGGECCILECLPPDTVDAYFANRFYTAIGNVKF